jgi:pullulanase/glycogen debranching enzyme
VKPEEEERVPTSLLDRKETHFVLWRPGPRDPAPKLVIGVGVFKPGSPAALAEERSVAMAPAGESGDVWEISAASLGLREGQVYHYWFEVPDTAPFRSSGIPLRCTDPAATAVDWRLRANGGDNDAAAAIVRWRNGKLVPTDAESEPVPFDSAAHAEARDVSMAKLPPNNRLVIYELPTAWTTKGDLVDAHDVGTGTFRDVRALIEGRPKTRAGHFTHLRRFEHRHLVDLGINALELLPPADTFADRKSWGYATSNYFAPDFDLGRPLDPAQSAAANDARASTAVGDLLALVRSCHDHGIRFFYDAVMAFANHDPYRIADFLDFHVFFNHGDPEQGGRDGFGGDLWKYGFTRRTYDPVTGKTDELVRARRHMIAHLLHWMRQYHVDGLRLDSVNNYGSWDFAEDIRRETRAAWNARWQAEGNPAAGADERFLVVGEELSVPKALLGRLDGLWNEDWKRMVRKVIVGQNADGEPSFEWSVRKLVDCRNLGFADGTQAVNYLGSHDVGGQGNERLYNYLDFAGVTFKEKPIKLAFACLLTSVGIPMILAGDEFGDQHDIDIFNGDRDGRTPDTNKQIDPVNFDRLDTDPWRQDLFRYVSRLVKLRTGAAALGVNDTAFIHVDFNDGKRVLVWKRGRDGVDDPVVVVANFSDWGTADPLNPAAEYVVSSWPATPAGKQWREVTQDRVVAAGRAGREPLFPWEAKVYALV